jgi:oligopeptide transport system substrate-binding protein
MPFNPSVTDWDKECQIVEQQLENLLGKDYIDIIIEIGPTQNFLAGIRRSGKYAFMKCNNGSSNADPMTWYMQTFAKLENTYNFMSQDPAKAVDGKPSINKTAATQAIVNEFYAKYEKAIAIVESGPRYTALAEAEAHLLDHAIAIPIHMSYQGYVAARYNPFERGYSSVGNARNQWKGMKVLEKPMSNAEFMAAFEQWKKERAAALAAAAK